MSDDEVYEEYPSDDDDVMFEDPEEPDIIPAPRPQTRANGGLLPGQNRYPQPRHGMPQDNDDDGFNGPRAGPMGIGGGLFGRFMNPGAFQAGFGGHAFARPPASAFRKQYRAFSTAILEIEQGRGSLTGGRSNLMYGGKIVMPPSALEELTQLDIELPIDFELRNPAIPDIVTHAGVLEFIASEGRVHLPQWMMTRLNLEEGAPIRIWGARLPKGKLVKIQPQTVDFLELSDPKAVLEQALRNFSCLTAGDIIEISYQTLTFRILIMEITPSGSGISVIDTDLEVDFAAPLGYVESERKPLVMPTLKDKLKIDTRGTQDVDARGSGTSTPVPGSSRGLGPEGDVKQAWEAFKGSGVSLSGKRIKGKGIKSRKAEEVDVTSRIFRTDKPRIITADTQIGGRQVPAALNLPFGTLFFGYENQRPAPGSAAEAEALAANAKTSEDTVPFSSVGTGNTLSGRSRPTSQAPAAQPNPPKPEAKPATSAVPSSGSGHSLTGPSARPTSSSNGSMSKSD